jgi:hypothetical protein
VNKRGVYVGGWVVSISLFREENHHLPVSVFPAVSVYEQEIVKRASRLSHKKVEDYRCPF